MNIYFPWGFTQSQSSVYPGIIRVNYVPTVKILKEDFYTLYIYHYPYPKPEMW